MILNGLRYTKQKGVVSITAPFRYMQITNI